ncbi:MAG: PadR family transcriptional regulator [Clostridiales bacterium]|nr:PadR family transcriptional regulator [Clostridiales bacterium]
MNDIKDIIATLTLELRRGTIVLSVISQLDTPKYGYSLVKSMEKKGVNIDTNTLYPLLRRLEKQGILISEWDIDETKPRKYYRITDMGNQVYEQLLEQWKQMVSNMDLLLNEGE